MEKPPTITNTQEEIINKYHKEFQNTTDPNQIRKLGTECISVLTTQGKFNIDSSNIGLVQNQQNFPGVEEMKNTPKKQLLQMARNIKTVKSGTKCVIINTNKTIKESLIPKEHEDFFQRHFNIYPYCGEVCEQLSFGDYSGILINVVYSPENKLPKNSVASRVLCNEVRGPIILFSEQVEINKTIVYQLIQSME